jgi:hypothetical protein
MAEAEALAMLAIKDAAIDAMAAVIVAREAAIERVKALIETWEQRGRECPCQPCELQRAWAADVRAALEG